MYSLRKHVKKPSRVTFAIAAVTVTATAAVTASAAAGSTSSATRAAHTAVRESASLRSADLTSYAIPERPLQSFRAHIALEHVQQIAADARIAAARAAAQRAAARRAAAKQAAANAAAAQTAPAQATLAAAEPSGSAQQIALGMLSSFGWSSSQFSCLVSLWGRESGWNVYASNPSSGAYGIPQALPGAKMASAGADWATDAATQIRWGLGYIQASYGSPCAAWDHSEAVGWY